MLTFVRGCDRVRDSAHVPFGDGGGHRTDGRAALGGGEAAGRRACEEGAGGIACRKEAAAVSGQVECGLRMRRWSSPFERVARASAAKRKRIEGLLMVALGLKNGVVASCYLCSGAIGRFP